MRILSLEKRCTSKNHAQISSIDAVHRDLKSCLQMDVLFLFYLMLI